MNQYLSEKLRIISLISIIMVVFLHSYNINTSFSSGSITFNYGYNFFVQNFFSQGIATIAVPIFFCISGYLFFLKFNGGVDEFILKYQKRAKSIVLPYLFWSIWSLFFFFILQLLPQSKNFFTNELVINYSLVKFLDSVFINPFAYQLWFLRDLIVLVLFSPVIFYLIKYFRIIPIVLFFIIYLGLLKVDFVIFTTASIFYFSIGAYFAIVKNNSLLKIRNHKYNWIFFVFWVCIVFLKTILFRYNVEPPVLLSWLYKINQLIGMIAVWSLYDIIMTNRTKPNRIMYSLSSFSFFIYAFHEPTQTLVKKAIFYIADQSEMIAMINYFLAPITTIMISIVVGKFIKQIAPKVYGFITGGR